MTGTQDRLLQRYTAFDASGIWIRYFYDADNTGWSSWYRTFQKTPDTYQPSVAVTDSNSIGLMRVTKQNGIVVMRWNINSGTLVAKGSSTYGITTLANALDSAYWPAYVHHDEWSDGEYRLRYSITTAGVVNIYNYTSVTSASTFSAYISTSWVAATQ